MVVKIFQIFESQALPYQHFINRSYEVAFKKATFEQSFAYDSADKFEVANMIWLDIRSRIRHIGASIIRILKQTVILIEHFFRELYEEVTSETTNILPDLPSEVN